MNPTSSWPSADSFATAVNSHCEAKGYVIERSETTDSRHLVTNVDVRPGARVRISLDGEVFELTFPGGYNWAEFAQNPGDGPEALADALVFVDAYADPATREVETRRWLRRPRRELHVSNGAVLRRRGWSKGPTDSTTD